jgi:hypothetical protein
LLLAILWVHHLDLVISFLVTGKIAAAKVRQTMEHSFVKWKSCAKLIWIPIEHHSAIDGKICGEIWQIPSGVTNQIDNFGHNEPCHKS